MISYREANPHDVPGLEAMRLPDAKAGPADPRMAIYLRREHHPQKALLPRVMYLAETPEGPIGYIGGHLTERYGCDGEVQYPSVWTLTLITRARGLSTMGMALSI